MQIDITDGETDFKDSGSRSASTRIPIRKPFGVLNVLASLEWQFKARSRFAQAPLRFAKAHLRDEDTLSPHPAAPVGRQRAIGAATQRKGLK